MRIKSWYVVFIILAALTACSSLEPPMTPVPDGTLTEEVVALPSQTPEAIAPVVEPTIVAQQPVVGMGQISECTLVSSIPDPPQEYAELFAVTEDDWVIGPADAAITLIEYGDFQ